MHPFRISWGRGRVQFASTSGDLVFQSFSTIVALSVIGLLVLIVAILFVAAEASIQTFGVGFLTGSVWNPTAGVFGAAPFVYGMLVTSAVALLLGVPISMGIAIFLSELAPPWLRIPLTYVVELLAAVPSVIYGLGEFSYWVRSCALRWNPPSSPSSASCPCSRGTRSEGTCSLRASSSRS